MAFYSAAPDVAEIGARLIAEHHRHLLNTRVEFLYRSEASRSGGRFILGKCRAVKGYQALLATPDVIEDPDGSSEDLAFFLIEVARDTWEMLNASQRIALVDHELCHARIEMDDDGDLQLRIAAHDVEEFGAILQRHGLWKPDLTAFIRALGPEQLSLLAENPPDDPPMIMPAPKPAKEKKQKQAAARGHLTSVPEIDE